MSVKDETTLLPSVPLSHSCVFDIDHKSLSAAYARVLHDKFRRLQIRLLSGASLDTSCEDMELFLGEAGSTDLEMQTLMSLLTFAFDCSKERVILPCSRLHRLF